MTPSDDRELNERSAVQGAEHEDERRFTNFYIHCRREWQDEWSCMCNDRCPVCDNEIEPYASHERDGEGSILHAASGWVPKEGLPDGTVSVEQLAGWP